MVSDYRYLIEACADQLWVVADQGGSQPTMATSTITGAWCCRARGMRSNSRDRGDSERDGSRDKPARNKNEKRVPAEAEDLGC